MKLGLRIRGYGVRLFQFNPYPIIPIPIYPHAPGYRAFSIGRMIPMMFSEPVPQRIHFLRP